MSTFRYFSVLTLATVLAMPLVAQAQSTGSPAPSDSPAPMTSGQHARHHRGGSFLRAVHKLDLTDAQKQQVAAFHAQEQSANANADAATKRANAAKMRDQIMGILTPDQKAQLSAAMHHTPGANGPAPMPSASPST